MITSWLLAYVAISVSCVLKVSSLNTFIAAVYEHAVILPNVTLTPVSREEALELMNRNLDLLEGAITSAAKQVLPLECAGFCVEEEWGVRRQGHCQVQLYSWMTGVRAANNFCCTTRVLPPSQNHYHKDPITLP